jgi:5-methylthioadenosine/S-adenosylhomocysteine deaminase
VAADLLLRNAVVLTMDAHLTVLEGVDVEISGRAISRIAPTSGRTARHVIDATGMLVMPGLINCHTHAAMTLMRGLADDMVLDTWWQKFIFPIEKRLVDPEFISVGTSLAAIEMIRTGTTSFTDMYFFEDEAAEACRRIGIRAFLGVGVLDFPTPDSATAAEALRRTEALAGSWRDDPIIHPIVAPHAPYTCCDETLLHCRALAERLGLPLTIHLSETPGEVHDSRGRHGCTPVQHLDTIGFLGPTLIAAHCVHVTDADLDILASREVKVAHCPESQMKLASGVAPVPNMLARGITVGLGTDGAASNNDLNLFGEMDTAAKCHKLARLDPTAVKAADVVRMATCEAAKAVGRPDLGSVEVGKTADIILVDLRRPNLTPVYNLYSLLVYSATGAEVSTVIVNGRPVMEDGRILTVDEAEVLDDATRLAGAIRDEVYS